MSSTTVIEDYWQHYLDTLPADHAYGARGYTAWGFGDNPELMDELGQLVQQGRKTATASLLWEYEAEASPMPQTGDISIILDGRGQPLCIIETVEIRILPFNAVDAQFAADEGEGDRTLAYWRDAHERFFARVCQKIQRTPSADMLVVCERFQVIFNQNDGATTRT